MGETTKQSEAPRPQAGHPADLPAIMSPFASRRLMQKPPFPIIVSSTLIGNLTLVVNSKFHPVDEEFFQE